MAENAFKYAASAAKKLGEQLRKLPLKELIEDEFREDLRAIRHKTS